MKPYQRYQRDALSEPILFYSDPSKVSLLALLGAAFSVGGLCLIVTGESAMDFVAGAVCLFFLGGGAVLTLPPYFTEEPITVLDEEGVTSCRYGVKLLWKDILMVDVREGARGGRSLRVEVNDYEEYRGKVSWRSAWLRFFTGGRLSSDFGFSKLDFPDLPLDQAGEIFEREAQRCGQ